MMMKAPRITPGMLPESPMIISVNIWTDSEIEQFRSNGHHLGCVDVAGHASQYPSEDKGCLLVMNGGP
jgi:hypothetical protein